MNRRNALRHISAFTLTSSLPNLSNAQLDTSKARNKKGVMLMNRIAPSVSQLYIANIDGTNERLLLSNTMFEYNVSPSKNGGAYVFTSERRADGQSDIYLARSNGETITPLVASDAVDDAPALSPDGRTLAFVSTRNGFRANIWLLDIQSGGLRQLTGIGDVRGKVGKPDGYFRPAWSHDGQWLAFSSDCNTEWTGHHQGQGWEHTQELSIYIIKPNGTSFRQVCTKPGYCLGSPKWSLDDKRIVFYEMTVEATWGARRPNYVGKTPSQIVSVDVATGSRIEHTSGNELKLAPQFINTNEIGYLIKYGPNEGLAYTSQRAPVKKAFVRSPSWTENGESVVYEKVSFRPVRPLFKSLFSWDDDWEYRHIDVFPQLSNHGWIVYTEKQLGNSSVFVMRADGSQKRKVFEASGRGLDDGKVRTGLAGAFQPCWSPDGQWIAFGYGYWFAERDTMTASLWRVRFDGNDAEQLSDGTIHSGFPSFSADGKELVYRVWSEKEKGLRVLNLDSRKIRTLTQGYDNLPAWSPDGKRIVFTRKQADGNFDIFTIQPNGGGLYRCTDHESSDGHAVWTADGHIMWSGSQHGFRDEAALYEQTFQQYGQIYIMDADGANKRMLTDSKWEDSMPLYLPSKP